MSTQEHAPARPFPGPRQWPLVGDVAALRQAKNLALYLGAQWQIHGDVFRTSIGGKRFLILSHPESVKQVLSSRRQNYVKGDVYDTVRRVLGTGLLTTEGDMWKARRTLMQPAFHRQSLERLTQVMVETGAHFLDALVARAHGHGQTHGHGGGERLEIDVHREMVKLTLDVVISALFGTGTASLSEASYESLGAALEIMSESANGILLPPWIPTPHNRKVHRTLRELDRMVYEVIASARARKDNSGSLLSMLLAATDDAGAPLSDAAIRDEVITLFIAGHETTALTLTWMFALLDGQRDVLARMQDEVARVLGGAEPTFESAMKLTYVRQVIDETLRLRPVVPLIPRNVAQDDTIAGYPAAKGDYVLLLAWAVHRHPDFWPNAERFDPERFGDAQSKGRHSWSYVPFSGGPRTCIGNSFSLVETAILAAQMLQRFDVDILSCADVKPMSVGTLRPSAPVRVVLRPRARARA